MPAVVSVVNHKGGVGKTTTVVGLAEFLASRGFRVLVVDLDTQASATTALVDPDRLRGVRAAGQTLARLFRDRLLDERRFDPEQAILHGVSNLGGGLPNLDLLPSCPELIDVQDRLAFIPPGAFMPPGPVHVLRESLGATLGDYGVALIDCPPSLGLLSLNGVAASHAYVVPVVPDVLSTAAVPQLFDRLRASAAAQPLGLIACKYRAQSALHRAVLEDLRCRLPLPLFRAVLPESSIVAELADVGDRPRSLRQKYRSRAVYAAFEALADEFLDRLAATGVAASMPQAG